MCDEFKMWAGKEMRDKTDSSDWGNRKTCVQQAGGGISQSKKRAINQNECAKGSDLKISQICDKIGYEIQLYCSLVGGS